MSVVKMRNLPLLIAVHIAACSFLGYIIYGILLDGPFAGTFFRGLGLAAILIMLGWLVNTILEAVRLGMLARAEELAISNLDVILPETDGESIPATVTDKEGYGGDGF